MKQERTIQRKLVITEGNHKHAGGYQMLCSRNLF